MTTSRTLSWAVALALATQGALGLAFHDAYRDTGYVLATWAGNDAVTLLLAVPLLALGLVLDGRGSARGRLLRLGVLGYGAYNYAFYLFGAALNAFFPLYVACLVLSGTALAMGLRTTDAEAIRDAFGPATPRRTVGGYMVFVAVALATVWLAMWALHLFAGRPVPAGDPDTFRLVAALDLSVIVPALGAGGALLWQGRPWGTCWPPSPASWGASICCFSP